MASALDLGFKRAFGAIVDANVTTLLAASVLYVFGSGPVKGFAVTLALGVITSLFTAILITRLLVVHWFRSSKARTLPI